MSVASVVEKATSDLLIAPDWGRNLELCDFLNSDPGQAKEAVKAVKKRLTNKNPKVQILALTVLETLIKNCGDSVHQQVAERDVLHEMVKIVKKKTDMNVRDKVLALLDSWQEAFGGPRGRYPQYFAAYDELRRSGIEFPERAPENAVPIFTPPQSHPITAYPAHPAHPYALAGLVTSETEVPLDSTVQGLSIAELENARTGVEVLTEMLNAVDPRDKTALKEELIVDLVEQCRTTQKQVMNLVNTTSDETLLFQALSLYDDLQKVLEKHDAIASGVPVTPTPENVSKGGPPSSFSHDEEETEDDFAQLAHRISSHSRLPSETVQKPTAYPIVPPPPQPAKLPAPPGARRQAVSVDLLSGDMYGAQSAQAAASHSKQPVQTEDVENLNPFALQQQQQQQQQRYVSNGTFSPADSSHPYSVAAPSQHVAPWASGGSDSQPLSAQQQALLYGQEVQNQKTPHTSHQVPQASSLQGASSLPPPPIKHSQRQQYFQQQHVPGLDQRPQDELSERTQNLSINEEDEMQNPYAALYSQVSSQQKQAANRPAERNSDNLFGELVDLQSAQMKTHSNLSRPNSRGV